LTPGADLRGPTSKRRGGERIGLEGRGRDRMGPERREWRGGERRGGEGREGKGGFPKTPPLKNPRSATGH